MLTRAAWQVSQIMDERGKRRKRRHSLRQLAARPVTITADGPVTIEAVADDRLGLVVRVWHPDDAAVEQAKAKGDDDDE